MYFISVQGLLCTDTLHRTAEGSGGQTWNLSKILHRQIFRKNFLHRQFHLILRVLVRKNTKKE